MGSQDTASHLYRRLTKLRRVLPVAAGLAVLGYETAKVLWLEGAWQPSPVRLRALFVELLVDVHRHARARHVHVRLAGRA